MAKKKTSFALSAKSLEQLARLAENDNRSMASMIEVLIQKASWSPEPPTVEPTSVDLYSTMISPRLEGALRGQARFDGKPSEKVKMETVEDLANFGFAGLITLRNVGKKSIAEARALCRQYGYTLKE